MKGLAQFIKTTVFGGLIFLIPIAIGVLILKKSYNALNNLSQPLAEKLGLNVGSGRILMEIIIILIIVLFCFLAGLLVRSNRSFLQLPFANRVAALLIPGFEIIKAQSHESIHKADGEPWQAVFLKGEISWLLAFIVERTDEGVCSVFVPEIPKMDAGELMIMTESEMEYIPINAKDVFGYLKSFGKGAATRFILEAKLKGIDVRMKER